MVDMVAYEYLRSDERLAFYEFSIVLEKNF